MKHVIKNTKKVKMALIVTLFSVLASPLTAQTVIEMKGHDDLRKNSGHKFTFINFDVQNQPGYCQTGGKSNNPDDPNDLNDPEYLNDPNSFGMTGGNDNTSQGSTAKAKKNNAHNNSAYELRFASWYLEDRIKPQTKTKYKANNNTFLNLANEYFNTDYTGTGSNTNPGKSNGQDQAGPAPVPEPVIVPEPTVVPAPGALMLAAIGVGITAIRNRKRLS